MQRGKSSQRRGNQMSRVNKTVESNEADDHLGREERLRKDSIIQTKRHTNRVRKQKGLPPHQVVDPVIGEGTTDDIENNRTIGDGDDAELVAGGPLIVGIRGYSADIGRCLTEDEVVAIHRRIRRERSRFRDLNGVMVEVGDVIPRFDTTKDDSNQKGKSRKEDTRQIPGVLKSIMVRLMPTEAEAVGEGGMTRRDVEAAMDKTVAAFEKATGCEVVTAVAHRMSVTDLHIHIQYTLVHPFNETSHMLGRRLKPWKQEASKIARESLLAEGVMNPGPATIGARKKKLIAEGLIPSPPEAHVEYRKVAGKRDLGDGAILGYSFRHKLNLVRAAEFGDEKELADQVARRNDERWVRFTPIANKPDEELDAKYLDLWLERLWRQNITSQLPEGHRDRLVAAGVEAAKNYAQYGSSIVEDTHIKRKIIELDRKAHEIEVQHEAAKKAEQLARETQRAAEEQRQHMAVEKRNWQDRLDEQSEQIEKLEAELSAAIDKPPVEKIVERKVIKEIPVIPPGLLHQHAEELQKERLAAEKIAAELDVVRKKVAGPAVPPEVQAVAQVLLDRMEKCQNRDKWETAGSTASRATSFLDWLENEPKRLMEKFKQLVKPIAAVMKDWPQAKPLLKFVGLGKHK